MCGMPPYSVGPQEACGSIALLQKEVFWNGPISHMILDSLVSLFLSFFVLFFLHFLLTFFFSIPIFLPFSSFQCWFISFSFFYFVSFLIFLCFILFFSFYSLSYGMLMENTLRKWTV